MGFRSTVLGGERFGLQSEISLTVSVREIFRYGAVKSNSA